MSGAAIADIGAAISSVTSKVMALVSVTVSVDPIGSVWVFYSLADVLSARRRAWIDPDGTGRTIDDITGNTARGLCPHTDYEGLEIA